PIELMEDAPIADGSIRHFQMIKFPLDPETSGFLAGIGIDVTDRLLAEQGLIRASARLEMLHEIDRAILHAESFDEMMTSALRNVRRLVPCRRASIVVVDPDRRGARRVAVDAEEGFAAPGASPVPVGDLAPTEGSVLGVRRIDDLAAMTDLPSSLAELARSGLRSVVTAALAVGDSLVGELELASDEIGAFSLLDEDVLRDVADQLAVAMRQAQLREELERYARELEGTVEALRAADEQRRDPRWPASEDDRDGDAPGHAPAEPHRPRSTRRGERCDRDHPHDDRPAAPPAVRSAPLRARGGRARRGGARAARRPGARDWDRRHASQRPTGRARGPRPDDRLPHRAGGDHERAQARSRSERRGRAHATGRRTRGRDRRRRAGIRPRGDRLGRAAGPRTAPRPRLDARARRVRRGDARGPFGAGPRDDGRALAPGLSPTPRLLPWLGHGCGVRYLREEAVLRQARLPLPPAHQPAVEPERAARARAGGRHAQTSPRLHQLPEGRQGPPRRLSGRSPCAVGRERPRLTAPAGSRSDRPDRFPDRSRARAGSPR